ncbi:MULTISPECIES: DUF190 domain-containing protein [Chryseobacterium]|uniref:Uncharacterized ACR, COG1993 n=2 Tax=Chryseobacterium gleum TaxID=250 RepID=A0A448B900_CHRGE|nr:MULTISPECIES: DUF190 domain-containing protein [Chryseobacterium]EFK36141.1 hypothetical protein HMPREF0204_15210 [Chryseobacterium gleum ATCC 35910]QQY31839.1 DUF190 domain-containing protein [Chryseobacterium gleum]UMQ43159.1 DUF190 domain-containing protein [Chryseobacterium sp. Y16C]VEE11049.1 Uncharacterized ACR, COG1993 [Chryseobacterium gleum]VFA43933.1 Uncharacterized ACR, COG1993 [Chryseobacterium indologenes]
MKEIIKKSLGKLKIYIEPSHKVKDSEASFFRKMFPKSAYLHIVSDAKKDGILNASVYQTHSGFSREGKVQRYQLEGNNTNLAICIELIDEREKLENFFLKHHVLLKDKIIIYKEVEFWET